MNDNFDSRFKSARRRMDNKQDKFDRDFEKTEKIIAIAWIVVPAIVIASLAGIAFVVYRLMLHFGIM